jgi:hypothetical protein
VPQEPVNIISEASVDAAVAALAERNRHHLEAMTDAERVDAVAHWRDLALAVLTAATAAIGSEPIDAESEGLGRAVLVFEDAGGEDVNIHASFYPELEDLGDGEVAVTPAQAAALGLLQEISGEAEEE